MVLCRRSRLTGAASQLWWDDAVIECYIENEIVIAKLLNPFLPYLESVQLLHVITNVEHQIDSKDGKWNVNMFFQQFNFNVAQYIYVKFSTRHWLEKLELCIALK